MSKARLFTQIWNAFKQLNPKNVENECCRRIKVAVIAPQDMLSDIAQYLLGDDPAAYDRASESLILLSAPLESPAYRLLPSCDIVLRHKGDVGSMPGVSSDRIFEFTTIADLASVSKKILQQPSLAYIHLPLARLLPAFRPDVAREIIQEVSVENSVFVASTSLGNVIPNPLQPLTSLAESLGDIVVLTANQLRMLFRLAGAYGREPSYKAQGAEIASIVGAALGWRSIARELVGALPMGVGMVPKAAIAFAGTWAVGDGIVYYYNTGKRLSKEEMQKKFEDAMEKGRGAAETVVSRIKESYEKIKVKAGTR